MELVGSNCPDLLPWVGYKLERSRCLDQPDTVKLAKWLGKTRRVEKE